MPRNPDKYRPGNHGKPGKVGKSNNNGKSGKGGAYFNESDLPNISFEDQLKHAIENSLDEQGFATNNLSSINNAPSPISSMVENTNDNASAAKLINDREAKDNELARDLLRQQQELAKREANELERERNELERERTANEAIARKQRELEAREQRVNNRYDFDRADRYRLLGLNLVPSISDSYTRSRVEDQLNNLIKKELNNELATNKTKSESEMISLVKDLVKNISKKKSSTKKASTKKASTKKASKKKSSTKKPSKKKPSKKKK